MKISFHGAAGCVTGSCYLVEFAGSKFLVDCGMFQGNKTLKEHNYGEFAFAPNDIDFVLVTHAHIDHSGLLPKLVKHGFSGPIYASTPTVDLLRFLLPDSARIQESEVDRKNRRMSRKGEKPLEPIYTEQDAADAIARLQGKHRGSAFEPVAGCRVQFRNAGHVLGSSFVQIDLTEGAVHKTLVFSGDLGEIDHPIVKDPEFPEATDVLVVESTYGGRDRPVQEKKDRLTDLARVIRETKQRGGNLVIPAFALERTQDLMHDMAILMGRGDIPPTDVIIDSPLAINLTKVFAEHPGDFDEDAMQIVKEQGDLFKHPRFRFTTDAKDSMALNGQTGLIILSASGMADAGRIKHHLKHNLWRPEATILFVGYQAEGTLGRLLVDGAKSVRIHGEEVLVKARIERIQGYSGHASQHGLIKWMKKIPQIREKVFVVHGEDDARAAFTKLIRENMTVEVACPGLGEQFDLLAATTAPQAVPTAPVVSERVAGLDSHNMYAEVMLKLAGYMRSNIPEEERRILLTRLSELLP